MSNGFRVDSAPEGGATTVSFAERFQSSEQFDLVFKEGMALVERTAAYLDGPGRKQAKGLASHVSVLYATESMRLTTRLLDLASWLLIRRAVKEGEITEEEASKKRRRVKLQAFGRPGHIKGYDSLPEGLRTLIEESFALYDRIAKLDRAIATSTDVEVADGETAANPVARQMGLLEQAFAGKLS